MNENEKPVEVRFQFTKTNIAIIISLASLIGMIVFGIIAWQQGDRADKLSNENLNIQKPSIIQTQTNVKGGTKGYAFEIDINNPSDTQYFIDFPNSLCYYDPAYMINQTNYTLPTNPINITNQPISNQSTALTSTFPLGVFYIQQYNSINPHETKAIYCPNFYIFNVTSLIKTSLYVCIKLQSLNDRICQNLDVNIIP